jgi:hypothetical protein
LVLLPFSRADRPLPVPSILWIKQIPNTNAKGIKAMPEDEDAQQTADDQGASEITQSDEETSVEPGVDEDAQQTTDDQGAINADWRKVANRAVAFLQSDTSAEADRTKCILNHILDESHSDGYISKDFYNVQQTAGGLPNGVSMEQFTAAITGHIRENLTSSSFDPALSDNDFRTAVMSFDSNIRKHITFLNGVVHQIAPGEVHLALWKLILDSRSDPNSIYTCYTDYLVDA